MAFSRSEWINWMDQQDRQAEGGRAVFWRPDPIWPRLHKQESWAKLLRQLQARMNLAVDVEYSAIIRGYRCEMTLWTKDKVERYQRTFLGEGYGGHPLGAIRDALAGLEKIDAFVRSALLEALIDYLAEEITVRRREDT